MRCKQSDMSYKQKERHHYDSAMFQGGAFYQSIGDVNKAKVCIDSLDIGSLPDVTNNDNDLSAHFPDESNSFSGNEHENQQDSL